MGNETKTLKHIAIIMDGNRRWAKARFLPSSAGHKKGVDALRKTIKACINFGIEYLTVYAFSTENKNRPEEEVSFLMSLFVSVITAELPEFKAHDVRVRFIGERNFKDKKIIEVIENCENQTQNNKTLNLQIAFNYGARTEITSAVKKLCDDVKNGMITTDGITEQTISDRLYTKNIPDPDLLIRTGGEKRISNYLLWQLAYTELYVTDTFWPDFDRETLKCAVDEFYSRERRFGK